MPVQAKGNMFRLGTEFPRMFVVEYERDIIPFFSGFVNYGRGSFDLEPTLKKEFLKDALSMLDPQDTFESNFKSDGWMLGVRLKAPFWGYLGVGYGSLSSHILANATGDLINIFPALAAIGPKSVKLALDGHIESRGPLIEYGNELRLGPVLIGIKGGVIFSPIDLSVTLKVDDREVTATKDDYRSKIINESELLQVQRDTLDGFDNLLDIKVHPYLGLHVGLRL